MFTVLNVVNPVAIILVNLRSLATSNEASNLPILAAQATLLAAVFLAGWFIFHISVPVLAERA